MRIAICEDESIFRKKLKEEIEVYYGVMDTIVDCYPSGEEFLKVFQKNPNGYELIFLDIEMKEIDGMETARRIRKENEEVNLVFLTSHYEFAPNGYEVNAHRFLTKPVTREKLEEALHTLQEKQYMERKLYLKESSRETVLPLKAIVYIEARNVNLIVYTKTDSYTVRKTLSEMEREVAEAGFIKVHRSFLINPAYVQSYTNQMLAMENGAAVPISRNRWKIFKEAFLQYVKRNGN